MFFIGFFVDCSLDFSFCFDALTYLCLHAKSAAERNHFLNWGYLGALKDLDVTKLVGAGRVEGVLCISYGGTNSTISTVLVEYIAILLGGVSLFFDKSNKIIGALIHALEDFA